MTACVPALVLVHGILQFNFDYDKNDEKWNCFLLNRTHSVAWGWVTPIWCASPIDYTDTQCLCLSYGCFVISFLHLSSSIFFIDMSFFYFLIISRCSLFIVHLFNGARLKSFFRQKFGLVKQVPIAKRNRYLKVILIKSIIDLTVRWLSNLRRLTRFNRTDCLRLYTKSRYIWWFRFAKVLFLQRQHSTQIDKDQFTKKEGKHEIN